MLADSRLWLVTGPPAAVQRRPPPRRPTPRESAAEALLRETRPGEFTPRDALDLVYRLKGLVAE